MIDCFIKRYKPCAPVVLPYFKMAYGQQKIDSFNRNTLNIGPKNTLSRYIAYFLEWPIICIFQSTILVYKHSGYTAKHSKVSKAKQFRQIVYLGIRHNLTPEHYYLYRLWLKENLEEVDYFLKNYQVGNLFKYSGRGNASAFIGDKYGFYKIFSAHDLEVAPTVCVSKNREESRQSIGEILDNKHSLFTKPDHSSGGKGAVKWVYHPSTNIWTNGENQYDKNELIHEFIHQEKLILQPCLENHSSLQDLAKNGLATLRIVTVKNPTRPEPEYLAAIFRVPAGNSIIDNFCSGGISISVSMDGELGTGRKNERNGEDISQHPDTNAIFTGRKIPYWNEAVALAKKAHSITPDQITIGWDIAILEDGPILVEANQRWGTEVLQMPDCKPVSELLMNKLDGII